MNDGQGRVGKERRGERSGKGKRKWKVAEVGVVKAKANKMKE